jgi:hypothetical protein
MFLQPGHTVKDYYRKSILIIKAATFCEPLPLFIMVLRNKELSGDCGIRLRS